MSDEKDLRTETSVDTDEERQNNSHHGRQSDRGMRRDLQRRHINMISIAGMIVSLT